MTRFAVAVLAFVLAAPVAMAEERRLTGEEVRAALAGNTARGLPPGPAYLQYFDPAGSTNYRASGRPPDRGLWRVDAAGDYCSQWRDGAWSCYQVFVDGDVLIWVAPESGTRYPATMLTGEVTE